MYSVLTDLNVGVFQTSTKCLRSLYKKGAGHPGEDDIGGLVLVGHRHNALKFGIHVYSP